MHKSEHFPRVNASAQKGEEKMELNKLKGKMRELGLTNEAMSKELGITSSTFSMKLNGKSDFSRTEISVIAKLMSLSDTEIVDIFLL